MLTTRPRGWSHSKLIYRVKLVGEQSCRCSVSADHCERLFSFQAVDVVGQAGKPKTITGFQTHTTPVLLAFGERAELAAEEYVPLTPIMEGFVILRKNPDFSA
jgi:hypothetical protein